MDTHTCSRRGRRAPSRADDTRSEAHAYCPLRARHLPLAVLSSLLRRTRQLRSQRALNLGDDLIVRDRLARLVLVDHLRLHVELRRELLLREALGVARLRDGEAQVLGHGLVLELL